MLTALVLTYNEEPNIQRCLARLEWIHEILVVDSGSTDGTIAIAKTFPNVRILHRVFDNHTNQWNYGLQNCKTDWVLSLDADYILSEAITEELIDWKPSSLDVALYARFSYFIFGRPLRASLYPPRALLFNRKACGYIPDGHTQLLKIEGPVGHLRGDVIHDDRKPLNRWFSEQMRYAQQEAAKLNSTPTWQLPFVDRLRLSLLFTPIFVFLYTYFLRGLILDGKAGLYYALQRSLAELLLSISLLDAKLR